MKLKNGRLTLLQNCYFFVIKRVQVQHHFWTTFSNKSMCSKNVTKVERFCYNFSTTFAHDISRMPILQNCYKNGDYFVTILIMQSVKKCTPIAVAIGVFSLIWLIPCSIQSRLHQRLISFQINCLFDIICNLSNPLSAESPIILQQN